MATEKQIAANRLNCLKGGVKTDEGKEQSKNNAASHGIFSKDNFLPGEDIAVLKKLRKRCMTELKPVGELETILVERIISSTWRLKRALNSEKKYTRPPAQNINGITDYLRGIDYRYDGWQNYLKYENALDAQIHKALKELKTLQKARLDQKNLPACIADVSATDDTKEPGNKPPEGVAHDLCSE
jgi:hypothetical protein